MIETGFYSIRYYDRYGSLDKGHKETAISYTEAQSKGNLCMADNSEEFIGLVSFTIDRRVFNSLDKSI